MDKKTLVNLGPVLKYPGSKWRLAKKIVEYIPDDHDSRVFPYGGAGGIMIRLPKIKVETYNDLFSAVSNFMIVLRDKPYELDEFIKKSPSSRYFSELCISFYRDPSTPEFEKLTDVQKAGMTYFYFLMSVQPGNEKNPGIRVLKHPKDRASSPPQEKMRYQPMHISHRLCETWIETLPAVECIKRYSMRSDKCLTLIDPPYERSERTKSWSYKHEMDTNQHIELFDIAHKIPGYAIVCGRRSGTYTQTYEAAGWRRIDFETTNNGGRLHADSIWINRQTINWIDGDSVPPIIKIMERQNE